MDRVSPQRLSQVARLARLELSEQDGAFADQLGSILGYAASLEAVDTEGAEPVHAPGAAAPAREDVVAPGLDQATATGAAPDTADGLIRVPRVLP